MKRDYLLSLDEQTVSQLELLAGRRNRTLSSLVDDILGAYLSQNAQDLARLLARDGAPFAVYREAGSNLISIKSALRHTYRPILRYTVRLDDPGGRRMGNMSMAIRTADRELLARAGFFLNTWAALESVYVRPHFPEGSLRWTVDVGRFDRTLMNPGRVSEEAALDALSGYLNAFDRILKSCLDGAITDTGQIEREYLLHRQTNPMI